MTKTRQNISLDPETFERFCDLAGRKGIKISTWINLKMKEFIEEEEQLEKWREEKKKHS